MRKWMLGCAVATLTAIAVEAASGQETLPTPTRVTTSTEQGTVLQKRGLLRGRRMVMVRQPAKQITLTRAQKLTTPTEGSGIQQAQFSVPATPAATTPSTQPVPPTQRVEGRQGLLARMRARLAR